jgi:hypothetical protein
VSDLICVVSILTLTSPRSRNGSTVHDETRVEVEGRNRLVDISPQSQRREGANVAGGVETSVDSEKTVALGCRPSQSRGGQQTRSSSMSFGRGRRLSINGR